MTKNDSRIPLNWKNNHCEAINHILKLNLKWKPAKMPDLIKMLQKEIVFQEKLTRGALSCDGNFELSDEAKSLRVPRMVWDQKKEREKQLLLRKVLSFGSKKHVTKTIKTTDGKLEIPATTPVARKPGQSKKRVCIDKMVSAPKRRKLVT